MIKNLNYISLVINFISITCLVVSIGITVINIITKTFRFRKIIIPVLLTTVGIGGFTLNYYSLTKQLEVRIAAEERVEKNLNIMLSTDEVSNDDRIKNHKKEYEAILKDGTYALGYMLDIFSKGQSDNLKEWLMAKVCSEIEKGIVKSWSTGRDWYTQYKKILNEQPVIL